MSWAEVKKINSDLSEPLNYLMWIRDVAMFGSEGYAFKNHSIELLMNSKYLTAHSVAMDVLLNSADTMTGLFEQTVGLGGCINRVYKLNSIAVNTIDSFEELLNSTEAFGDIIGNNALITRLVTLPSTMIAMSNNVNAMTMMMNNIEVKKLLHASPVAEDAIRNSAVALSVMETHSQVTTHTKDYYNWSVQAPVVVYGGKVFVMSLTRVGTWNSMSATTALHTTNFLMSGTGDANLNRMYNNFSVRGSVDYGTTGNVTVTSKFVVMDA